MVAFSLLGNYWQVERTSKEENRIKSISAQKMENSVLFEWAFFCPIPIYLCICKAEQLRFRQNYTFEYNIQDSFNCK